MKSSFRSIPPKTVQMMKNDENGLTGSVNCLKMHSIRKAETVHETDSTNAELKRRAANGVLNRLTEAGAAVYRTDQAGDITITR